MAEKLSFDEPWAAIQIGDDKSSHPKISGVKRLGLLQVEFLDLPWEDPDSMKDEHAQKIWEFVASIKDKVNVLLVHCYAGQCRSPAVANILADHYQWDDVLFMTEQVFPNRWVAKVMDASRPACNLPSAHNSSSNQSCD